MNEMKRRGWYYAWIGLNDRAAEGKFVWASGQENSYTNWLGGQPDGGRSENCVYMWYDGGVWFDYECNDRNPFICERWTIS